MLYDPKFIFVRLMHVTAGCVRQFGVLFFFLTFGFFCVSYLAVVNFCFGVWGSPLNFET